LTQVWYIDIITITLAVFKLAGKERLKEPSRRGSKGYSLAERIAVLTYIILGNTSYFKALRKLEETIIPRKK